MSETPEAMWARLPLEVQHELDGLVKEHRSASAVKLLRKADVSPRMGIAEARDVFEYRKSILKPPPLF
ncbi:hypothetical protein [Amycolatopsis benzoatilytica]|uniref:hypothetical protein n=1 Tax=Amycolatopsis benzoatilytica TaxID=346045 RepID=UPI0003663EEB|nr:hypothetical protein [Amycolatopsis benzoatilytica]